MKCAFRSDLLCRLSQKLMGDQEDSSGFYSVVILSIVIRFGIRILPQSYCTVLFRGVRDSTGVGYDERPKHKIHLVCCVLV
jgi:hypothetical protein